MIKVTPDIVVKRNIWYLRYRFTDPVEHKLRERVFSTRMEATPRNKAAAYAMLAEKQEEMEYEINKRFLPPSQFMDFTIMLEKWKEDLKYDDSLQEITKACYLRNLDKHVIPYFQPLNLKAKEVKVLHIEAFYRYLQQEKKLSNNTVLRVRSALSKCFTDYVRKDVLQRNPVLAAKAPRQERKPVPTLSKEELIRISEIFKEEPMYTFVEIVKNTGLRREEALALKWEDIDFEQETIKVRRTRVPLANQGIQEKERCKNRASQRTVFMTQQLKMVLLDWKERQEECKKLLGRSYYQEGKAVNTYICTWEDGKPLSPDYVTHRFKDVISQHPITQITIHGLRHTIATLLSEDGCDAKKIQVQLGHSTINTTMDMYVQAERIAAHKTAEMIENFSKK